MSRSLRHPLTTLVLSLAMLLGSCKAHVQLKRTSETTSLRQRESAYSRLHPTGTNHRLTLSNGTVIADQTSSLVLANGATIHHAADLLAIVHEDSATARTAKKSADARFSKWFWGTAGTLASTIGFALMLQSFGDDDIYAASLVAMGGGGGALLASYYYERKEQSEKKAAFATYDASLRESLNLCLRGDRLVDCASDSEPARVIRRSKRRSKRRSEKAPKREEKSELKSLVTASSLDIGLAKLTKKTDAASDLQIATFSYQVSLPIQFKVQARWTREEKLSGPIVISVISEREDGEIFDDDAILVLVANGAAPIILESRWQANQLSGGVTREVVSARITPNQLTSLLAELKDLRIRVGDLDFNLPEGAVRKLIGFVAHVSKRLESPVDVTD